MSFMHYILQVNIYLLVFYGFYRIFLSKETYFMLNRLYLISAGILSLAIPFIRFEWLTSQPAAQPVYTTVGQVSDYISMVIVPDQQNFLSLGTVLSLIYLSGIAVFLIRFIIKLVKLKMLLTKTTKGTAFSFLGKKVIDKELPQYRTIENHEDTHIKQLHSLDILLFELIGILNWFNPVIYFYKHTIKNIHEYLADEEAANFQGNKEQYALLLLSSALGVSPGNLTNSFFNKSLIKKRIYMLHKQRSTKTAILKYGLFLPLFATTLVMSSATIRNNQEIQDAAETVLLSQSIEAVNPTDLVNSIKTIVAPRSVRLDTGKIHSFTSLDQQPTFPGGMEQFYKYLKSTVVYPELAKTNKIEGKVFLSFVVEKDGTLANIKVDRKLGGGTDEEAVRVLSVSPRWIPGLINGQPVRVKYNIPISFKLPAEQAPAPTAATATTADFVTAPVQPNAVQQSTQEKVYDFVSLEQQPTFPGGMNKFYDYLAKEAKYPAEAQKNNITGKVFLSFIVEKDGKLNDIKVDRGLGHGLDEEAVRLIKNSPNWVAGIQQGEKVRVKYNIPISFNLAK